MSTPAENLQGDYIEAAIHALNANRPDVALRYLNQYAVLSGNLRLIVKSIQAGESND